MKKTIQFLFSTAVFFFCWTNLLYSQQATIKSDKPVKPFINDGKKTLSVTTISKKQTPVKRKTVSHPKYYSLPNGKSQDGTQKTTSPAAAEKMKRNGKTTDQTVQPKMQIGSSVKNNSSTR